MRKMLAVVLAAGCLSTAFCSRAHASQAYSSNELIVKAASLDNTQVTFEGEVIGDIMKRTAGTWVNVNDGSNAIGCWIVGPDAGLITRAGSYRMTGDRVLLEGVFHRACPEHGGDLDIHAASVSVTVQGVKRSHGTQKHKKEVALYLLGGVCLALMLKVLK